jgi:hypothetical protein
MKIMVFLHGTVIMHRNALGRTREERVRQVMDDEESVHDFASYIPVENAVRKLQTWRAQGADLVYLSSHKNADDVEKDKAVLQAHGFPDGPIFYSHASEPYAHIAENVLPDVLIEDDCESIGGEKQMTYPHIRTQLKAKMKSIAVKEFGGIDHLPDDVSALMSC